PRARSHAGMRFARALLFASSPPPAMQQNRISLSLVRITPRSTARMLSPERQKCFKAANAIFTFLIPRALAKSLPLPQGTTRAGSCIGGVPEGNGELCHRRQRSEQPTHLLLHTGRRGLVGPGISPEMAVLLFLEYPDGAEPLPS